MAALKELQDEAYKNAVYQEKLVSDSRKRITANISGDITADSSLKLTQKAAFAATQEYERLKKQIESMSDNKVKTKFTGEASPEKPLTDTLKDITGGLEGFLGKAKDGSNIKLGFGDLQNKLAGAGGQDFSKMFQGMMGSMSIFDKVPGAYGNGAYPMNQQESKMSGIDGMLGLKDMGKVDINMGGKAMPVVGKQEVLKMFTDIVNEQTKRGM
jgi:hypothetical protein